MKNQIIKNYIDFIDNFLKERCIKENNYYIFNEIVYKKIVYNDELNNFLESLKEYYYPNKYFYLDRKPFTYKLFSTVLRQILNNNNIKYEKKVKYYISKYTTEYFIYLDE